MMRRLALLLLVLCLIAPVAQAHDLRSGYFEVTETGEGSYDALWKTPSIAGRQLDVLPVLPDDCAVSRLSAQPTSAGGQIESWRISCDTALTGRTINFDRLETFEADVLVRLIAASGDEQTLRVTHRDPVLEIPAEAHGGSAFWAYFVIGVEHILIGLDHLLFLLCLIFLIRNVWRLVSAITAFTIAHSLTLGGTVLGLVHLPIKPVEAVIALSIVFLAAEVLAKRTERERLSERMPWLVAFVFGLLHGFGFASVLQEIGLPQNALVMSLLAFNLGVEAGQLVFVGTVLLVIYAFRRLRLETQLRTVSVYSAGIIATKWFIERML